MPGWTNTFKRGLFHQTGNVVEDWRAGSAARAEIAKDMPLFGGMAVAAVLVALAVANKPFFMNLVGN